MDKANLQIFQNSYADALKRNTDNIKIYEDRKRNLENLNLKYFTESLTIPVLVSVGKKVLIRGTLTNTNNFTVALSDEYFVKCSLKQAEELRQSRIQRVNKFLQDLEKEKDYLLNQTTRMQESVFDTDGKEIIESFDEDEENKWREQHKINIKKYKNIKMEDSNETYENMMDRLDELELQEEMENLNEKLNTEGVNDTAIESNMENQKETATLIDHISDAGINKTIAENESKKMRRKDILNKLKGIKKKSSFECQTEEDMLRRLDELEEEEMLQDELDRLSEDSSEENSEERESETETRIGYRKISFDCPDKHGDTLTLNFSHSKSDDLNKEINPNEDHIVRSVLESPSDIYSFFPECFNREPKPLKSILKTDFPVNNITQLPSIASNFQEIDEKRESFVSNGENIVIGDVIEMNEPQIDKRIPNRPISKFKAMRLRAKN